MPDTSYTTEIVSQEEKMSFLQDTLKLREDLEGGFLVLGARLARIRDEELYTEHYNSFREFLDEARLNESFASRLITIHKKLVEGVGIPQEQLAPIGWSSLYQIAKYTDDPEETKELVEMASHVRRQDIEDELRERTTGCKDHEFNEERVVLARCKHCGKMERVNEENH